MVLESGFVRQAALDAGFDVCGIARVCSLETERRHLSEWLSDGLDGGLDYMRRNLDKRLAPDLLVSGAKSVIVCGVNYRNDISAGYPDDCGAPKIASYACTADYHDTIKEMLRKVAAALSARYGDFGWRAFCDSAPVLEKRWAVEAGLGWQGRNSLVINPRLGSFFLLGELIADAESDVYDRPHSGPGCGGCRRCIDRCPNGAISPDGYIDARRCIARATIEKYHPPGMKIVAEAGLCEGNYSGGYENGAVEGYFIGPDSEAGEIPLHGWMFGCDECQSVCPYNITAPMHANPEFGTLLDPRELGREYWLSLTEEEFRARFRSTPMYRTGLARLKESIDKNSENQCYLRSL